MDNIEFTDVRLGQKIEVKVGNKWYKLIYFNENCPYGKYAIKKQVKKTFNPYCFFDEKQTELLEKRLSFWDDEQN